MFSCQTIGTNTSTPCSLLPPVVTVPKINVTGFSLSTFRCFTSILLKQFPKMMLLSEIIKEQDMYQLLVRKCREKAELVDQLLFFQLPSSHNMYQMWIPMNWSI